MRDGRPRPDDWREVETTASDVRRRLSRTLRRELVHDPRSTAARRQNFAPDDLADEALAWAFENWKAKPAAVTPEQWMRKRALQILDESLDREALAAESRAEERAVESGRLADDAHNEDEGRADWIDVSGMAAADGKTDGDVSEDPFDGLVGDPLVNSPADRYAERETLAVLDAAMRGLPERRRRVVAHRYFDGLAVEDIAYLLDTTSGDVRHEIAAGIEDLRREVAART
jgi:RNA polymerase sigma factor (sigma-70 family)